MAPSLTVLPNALLNNIFEQNGQLAVSENVEIIIGRVMIPGGGKTRVAQTFFPPGSHHRRTQPQSFFLHLSSERGGTPFGKVWCHFVSLRKSFFEISELYRVNLRQPGLPHLR